MMVGSKAKLAGQIDASRFKCVCCGGMDRILYDDTEKKETYIYCRPCFTTNCKCAGVDMTPVA